MGLKIIMSIPLFLLLVACSENNTQSTNATDDVQPAKVKTHDNTVAVTMPRLSNDIDLPTDTLEVKEH